MGILQKIFGSYSEREIKRVRPVCDQVLALEEKYAPMSDSELRSQTQILRDRLAAGETLDDILPDAYAVCREAGWRVRHIACLLVITILKQASKIGDIRLGIDTALQNGETGEIYDSFCDYVERSLQIVAGSVVCPGESVELNFRYLSDHALFTLAVCSFASYPSCWCRAGDKRPTADR